MLPGPGRGFWNPLDRCVCKSTSWVPQHFLSCPFRMKQENQEATNYFSDPSHQEMFFHRKKKTLPVFLQTTFDFCSFFKATSALMEVKCLPHPPLRCCVNEIPQMWPLPVIHAPHQAPRPPTTSFPKSFCTNAKSRKERMGFLQWLDLLPWSLIP